MRSPRPTEATLVVRSEGPMWSSAPTDRRGSYIDHLGQRRTAERLRRGCEGMGGNRGRDHPQRGQQFRAIPQSPFRRQLPLHKGALGTGDADCRVGPLGLLAMTMDFCHSEASAHTGRGNPSFLRWTGVRAAEVVGPYGRSTKVPATGRCGHRPLRVVAESCRDHPGSDLSAERVAGQIQSLPDD